MIKSAGYFGVNRSDLSPLWKDHTALAVYMYLLNEAEYEAKTVTLKTGKSIKLKIGDAGISMHTIADDTGIAYTTVRNAIERLEEEYGLIKKRKFRIQPPKIGSVFTVQNYAHKTAQYKNAENPHSQAKNSTLETDSPPIKPTSSPQNINKEIIGGSFESPPENNAQQRFAELSNKEDLTAAEYNELQYLKREVQ